MSQKKSADPFSDPSLRDLLTCNFQPPPPRVSSVAVTPNGDASRTVVPEPAPARSPTTPEMAHEAEYHRRVAQWQREECNYMHNPQWCEHRVILLLQEAFLPHYRKLKEAYAQGQISHEEYRVTCAEVRAALTSIKSEYRRTLQRLRDRNASEEELAALASKAVTCVASVYPWSSDGFLLPYQENKRFAELALSTALNTPRPAPPAPTTVAPKPQAATSGAPAAGPKSAGPAARSGGMPRPSLQPLPIRKDDFVRSVAPDGSVVVTAAVVPQRETTSGLCTVSPPPPIACTAVGSPTTANFASPLTTPGSPPRQLPPSVTGPIRPEEMRFFERKQLVQTPRSFFARSLAAVPFVGVRRSVIAQQSTRQRLANCLGHDALVATPTLTPKLIPVPDASAPASPQQPLPLTPRDCAFTPELSSTASDGSLGGDATPMSQLSRRDSFADACVGRQSPLTYFSTDGTKSTSPLRSSTPPIAASGAAAVTTGVAGSYSTRPSQRQPLTPQMERIVKSLW